MPGRHALTVDVEDWFHAENLRRFAPRERWSELESRIAANVDRLLELFLRTDVKATFFVLGRAVEHHPSVVQRIVAGNHELACHGWSHELVYRQTPEEFREETRRSKAMLEDMGGVAVRGYRASTFSVTEDSLWALDILAEEGFLYDSSIAPLRHDRYGIPDEHRDPHVRELPCGRSMIEFPVSMMRVMGLTFPLGGGFFRLFPLSSASRALHRYEQRGSPAMIYVHPWELDPDQPRATGLKFTHRVRHYARLKTTESKLERLLTRHSWCPMEQTLKDLLQASAAPRP